MDIRESQRVGETKAEECLRRVLPLRYYADTAYPSTGNVCSITALSRDRLSAALSHEKLEAVLRLLQRG